ncbi:MAG: HNH endonuclease [Roseburia sp.]
MWKQVLGYENVYEINENGDLRRCGSTHLINRQMRRDGYQQYSLSVNGKRKSKKIHRLVAETFIENPNNYNVVNHIDGNKLNNNYKNLEWCTSSKNNFHAWENGLNHSTEKQIESAKISIRKAQSVAWEKRKKRVICIDTGEIFASIKECAEHMNLSDSKISDVCKGKRNTTGGLRFNYL